MEKNLKFPWIYGRIKSENPDWSEDQILIEYKRIYSSHSYESILEKYGKERADAMRARRKYTSSKQYYIDKYGEVEGEERWIRRNKTRAVTLDKMILKHGPELGPIMYQNWIESCKNTLPNFQKKYGIEEGTRRYNSWLGSKGVNLENQIRKYGEELGPIKYKQSVENRKNTLDNFIKRHGEVLGRLKYEQYVQRSKNTLENFQRIYGEEEGLLRHREYVKKATSPMIPYSKISKELFDKLISKLNLNRTEVLYADNEYQVPVTMPSGRDYVFSLDFYHIPSKKAIEFFGDFWHKNAGGKNSEAFSDEELKNQMNWDLDRINVLLKTEEVSDIYIVWESDYKLDPDKTLNELTDYLLK